MAQHDFVAGLDQVQAWLCDFARVVVAYRDALIREGMDLDSATLLAAQAQSDILNRRDDDHE